MSSKALLKALPPMSQTKADLLAALLSDRDEGR